MLDVTNGSVILTLTTNDPAGICPPVNDQMTIIFNAPAQVNAGPDQSICGQVPVLLNGTIGGSATSGTWTTSGTGTFIPNNTTLNATYNPSAADVLAGSVILTLTTDDPAGPCPSVFDQMTIFISTPALVNAGPDQTVCGQTAVLLNGSIGGSAVSATWTTSGTGTFTPNATTLNATYNPSLADVAAGSVILTLTTNDPAGICPPVNDQMTIIFNAPAQVNAGPDQSICGQVPVSLNGTIGGSATSGTWTTSGTGTFIPNNTTLNATYNPSAADVLAGSVILTLTTDDPAGPCPSVFDQMTIFIGTAATVDAGPDQTICEDATALLNGTIGGSATIGTWTTSGSGTFTPNNTTLNATYTPSAADVLAGSVILTLTTDDPAGPCPSVFDQMTIFIGTAATVDAGPDQTICEDATALLNGTIGGSATIGTWTTSGSGTFTPNNTTLNATYTPSAADIAAGVVTLTLTTDDPPGACPPVSDFMLLTIDHLATNNIISANQDLCTGSIPNQLIGTIPTGGNGTYTYQWESSTVGAAGPFTPILGATGQNYQPGLLLVTTWFRRIVTSPPCGPSTSNVIVIQVFVSPTALAGPDQTICNPVNGGSAILGQIPNSASGGNPPYTYLWTTNPPSIWNSNIEHPVVAPTVTTTYVLQITDQTPCTDMDTVVIYVRNYIVHANAGGDQTICNGLNGGAATLGGIAPFGTGWGGVAPYTYLWSSNPPDNSLNGQTTISNPLVQPTIATTYTVTVTDANGCTATDNVIITLDPMLYANAGVDDTVCSGDSFVLGGNPTAWGGTPIGLNDPPYVFLWSSMPAGFTSSEPNPIIFPTGCVTYIVDVIDGHGCRATDTVVVCSNPPIFVNAGPDQSICNGNNGGFAILAGTPASGGTPPFTYSWMSNPGSFTSTILNPTVNPTITTTYTLTATDAVGCTGSDDVIITVNPEIIADAGLDQTMCHPNNNDSIVLGGSPTGSGGTPPLTYLWSSIPPGFTSTDPNPVVQPIVQTTYQVIVNDASGLGCGDTDIVVISVNPEVFANAGNDKTICGGPGGSAIIGGAPTGSGGTAPYTYLWTSDPVYIWDPLSQNTESNPIVSPTITTTFIVAVTDAVPCVDSDTVIVFVNPIINVNAGADTAICTSSPFITITLGGFVPPTASGGTPPYTYIWSSTPLGIPITNPTDANPTATINTTITSVTFTVMVSDATGICNASDTKLVTINPFFIAEAGNDTTLCGPNTVTLGGNPITIGGTPDFKYLWTAIPPYSWNPLGQDTLPHPIVTPTITTTFYLRVTDHNGIGCEANDSMIVTIDTPVIIDSITFNNPSDCDTTDGSATVWASGGVAPLSYIWSTIPPQFTQTATGLDNGTYFVTVTSALGTCSVVGSVTLRDPYEPWATLTILPDTTICMGDTVTIIANANVTPITTYEFFINATSVLGPGSINRLDTALTTTSLITVVVDSAGCQTTLTQMIHVNDLLINAGNDTLLSCPPCRPIQIGSAGISGYTYLWRLIPPGGYISDTLVPMPWVQPLVTTTYVLFARDTIHGCSDIDSVIFTVTQLPTVFVGNDDTICSGDCVTIGPGVPPPTGCVFNWTSIPNGFNSNQANVLVCPTEYTRYIFTMIDTVQCCIHQGHVAIDVFDVITNGGYDTTICTGQSVTIGGPPQPHYSYFWQSNEHPPFTSTLSNPTVSPLYSAKYYETVYDSISGCTAYDSVFVNVDIPPAYAGKDTSLCYGDAIMLGDPFFVDTTLYTYHWTSIPPGFNTNVPTPVVSPSDTTYYILTVTSRIAGCVSIDTVRVGPKPTPVITLVSDKQGNIIYGGQIITFTAFPENYALYEFYIDGEKEQSGTSNIFKTDKVSSDSTIVTCIAENRGCESWPVDVVILLKTIPNAFTPNGDGINDIFLEGMDLTIVNRWGQTMYMGTKGWDGKYHGQKVSPGTYYYILKVKDLNKVTTVLKGAVTIIDIKQ